MSKPIDKVILLYRRAESAEVSGRLTVAKRLRAQARNIQDGRRAGLKSWLSDASAAMGLSEDEFKKYHDAHHKPLGRTA